MRCRNCGWDNPENNAKSEKCNAPLDGSMMYEHQPETRQNHTEDNSLKSIYTSGNYTEGNKDVATIYWGGN